MKFKRLTRIPLLEISGLLLLTGVALLARYLLLPAISCDGITISPIEQVFSYIRDPLKIVGLYTTGNETQFLCETGSVATGVIVGNLVWVICWWMVLRLFFRVSAWQGINRARTGWVVMMLVSAIVSMAALALAGDQINWILIVLGLFSAAVVFYLGTTLFSPPAHKFVAPGAMRLRRW
jgi:hypothetical protein